MENQALLPYRSSENRKIAESGLNKPKRDYGLFKFLALSYVVIHSSIWYFLSDSTLRISPDGRKEGVQHSRERIWRFTDIEPQRNLDWKPCGGPFVCARLSVPLDYSQPDGTEAAIALIKLPAPIESESFNPSILMNPGGPGGSGVSLVETAGQSLQVVLGLQYSIIGFDPRGVNNTTPGFDCFQTNPIARDIFLDRSLRSICNTSSADIGEHFVSGLALGKQCAFMENDGSSAGPHMNTPVVARDMLSIVHAEQREHGLKAEDGKLWYWGFSYGSVLGTTFAAMFPDRVGRLIVDAVVDVDDYYAGTWESNLSDTEKVMDSFYQYCFEAGPESCAFYTGTSPTDIRKRLRDLLEALRVEPVPVYNNTFTGLPEVITYTDLRRKIFMSLYSPVVSFPALAKTCVELEAKNGDTALRLMRWNVECNCLIDPIPTSRFEASPGIFCADGNDRDLSLEEFKGYVDYLVSESPTIGGIWALHRTYCIKWDIQQKWPLNVTIEGNTSFPLLFIGNTADPVTPLKNVYKMVKRFDRAGVLVQRSEGHGSMSTFSTCTIVHIRNYMQKGELPKENTICEVEIKPFLGYSENISTTKDKSMVDLKTAANDLMEIFANIKYF